MIYMVVFNTNDFWALVNIRVKKIIIVLIRHIFIIVILWYTNNYIYYTLNLYYFCIYYYSIFSKVWYNIIKLILKSFFK